MEHPEWPSLAADFFLASVVNDATPDTLNTTASTDTVNATLVSDVNALNNDSITKDSASLGSSANDNELVNYELSTL